MKSEIIMLNWSIINMKMTCANNYVNFALCLTGPMKLRRILTDRLNYDNIMPIEIRKYEITSIKYEN